MTTMDDFDEISLVPEGYSITLENSTSSASSLDDNEEFSPVNSNRSSLTSEDEVVLPPKFQFKKASVTTSTIVTSPTSPPNVLGLRKSVSTPKLGGVTSVVTVVSSPVSKSRNSAPTPSKNVAHVQTRPLRRTASSISQTRKKLTAEQLEMLYDSEVDDDIIIDNNDFVWNIPLSPSLYKKASNTLQQHINQPKVSPPVSHHRSSKRMSARKSNTNLLSSIKESEPTKYFETPGLEYLSEDARNLTKALYELPEGSTGNSSSNSSSTTSISSNKQTALVPPKRVSDIDDVVPISKEKAEFLSRTRPSFLPPKSKEEELKHLLQYKEMMIHATSLEKKRERELQTVKMQRAKERAKIETEWTLDIIPRFELAVKEAKTRELWWKGIPLKYRALIWKARTGNQLGITKSTYVKALQTGKENGENKIMILDSQNALPNTGLFGAYSPLSDQLLNILTAFSAYRSEIGYKSGLHHIAATLLLTLSTELEVFTALANILNNSLLQAIYLRDETTLTSHYTSFLKVLNTKLPSLYEHFKTIRLPPSAYLEPMLSTLYSQHMPIDVTDRIWDVMMFEGDTFLLRVALGVLMKVEHKLYGSAEDVLSVVGWGAKSLEKYVGDEDEFMACVRGALKNTKATTTTKQ